MQYGRQKKRKWNTVLESLTRKPTEAPAVSVNFADSTPVMTSDVRLKTLNPLAQSRTKPEDT